MKDRETALIIGATSDIGRAIARRLARDGCALQLAARHAEDLAEEVQDMRARTAGAVTAHRCDVLDADGGVSLLDALEVLPDVAVCVVGLLGDQQAAQGDGAVAQRVMRTNYVGPALLLAALAERFEQRGRGVLAGVSSVAGDRGRASNYVYGSAKAGFSAFLSGLRNRPRRLRGSRRHRQAGLRPHPHDRRHGPAAAADGGAGRSGAGGGRRDPPATRRGVRQTHLARDHADRASAPRARLQAHETVAENAAERSMLTAETGVDRFRDESTTTLRCCPRGVGRHRALLCGLAPARPG